MTGILYSVELYLAIPNHVVGCRLTLQTLMMSMMMVGKKLRSLNLQVQSTSEKQAPDSAAGGTAL